MSGEHWQGKVKSSSSASYMRRTQDKKRFTILEVAADWSVNNTNLDVKSHLLKSTFKKVF